MLDDLRSAIAADTPEKVLFWSGAGSSVPAPASLPTGWQLTERIFRTCFEPDALATTLGYHARSSLWAAQVCDRPNLIAVRPPRLETVAGVAARRFPDRLHTLLDDVRAAEPNWAHRFFAAHLHKGGMHITANFDTCIERAHHTRYGQPPDHDSIRHVHGTLDATAAPTQLGLTLQAVQAGFSSAEAGHLTGRVAEARTTVMMGYSGSDFFDVDVAFAALPDGWLTGRTVAWVAHSDTCDWHEVTPLMAGQPPLAGHLAAKGAHVRLLCGPTNSLLAALASAWQLDVGPEPGASLGVPRVARPARRTPVTTPPVADSDRRAATFDLYRELGLPAEVDRMLLAGDLDRVDPVEMWQARSETLWEQGKWSTLRRLWARGDLPAGITPAMRTERIGACLWAQGRLLPAYLCLHTGRRRAHRAGRHADAWLLAETEGRVVEHMARTPELRLLARALAGKAAARLGAPAQRDGVHRFRRHRDLMTSLAAVAQGQDRSVGEADTSRRWFTEAGSIIAAVAYSHRTLRDSYHPDIPDRELAQTYRAHCRWAQAVGSPAAAWRVILLPGAARVFTLREVVAACFALEYAPWHRVRILARWLAARVRSALLR